MAQDIFIRFSGVEGESQDFQQKGAIDVLRWTWSVSHPADRLTGPGSGVGKPTVSDLCFEHRVDKASPRLLQYCLSGKPVSEATLTVRKAGGSPLEYLRIMLQEIIITHVENIGYDTMPGPREKVSLSFARVNVEYILQSAEGNNAGTRCAGYDIKASARI